MRARLYVGLGDKPVCVLVGALDWIEQRAKAYAKKKGKKVSYKR